MLTSCLLASDAILASNSCNALLVTAPQTATEFTVTGTDNANILYKDDKKVLLERVSAWRGGGMIGRPLTVKVSMKKGAESVQHAEIKQPYCFTQSGNINVAVHNRTPMHEWAEPKISLANHGVSPGTVEFN
jgi:hypothetical protein